LLKRFFDITASVTATILLLPILGIIYILVRFSIGSPVFFRQLRPGLNAKPFMMVKFRTMTDAKDATGKYLSDNERLTSFGRFLRSSSLDELPELLNVIKGEMSIVGPRPLLMDYLPLYNEEQLARHVVRPGITGWAQVNGRNAITWEEKFRLDLWYIENSSFWIDCKIIALTIRKVLGSSGVNAGADVTMPAFTGNKTK
jgi:lipopolysaccharide/colanic/teichoic acid biosynthesis glycosyltransferase